MPKKKDTQAFISIHQIGVAYKPQLDNNSEYDSRFSIPERCLMTFFFPGEAYNMFGWKLRRRRQKGLSTSPLQQSKALHPSCSYVHPIWGILEEKLNNSILWHNQLQMYKKQVKL